MRIVLLFILMGYTTGLLSQSYYVIVDSISITGNKKTKADVVKRELDFSVGDSIEIVKLRERIEWNKLQLLNTGLFAGVEINILKWKDPQNRLILQIELDEAWFIYPIPIFELADRNFNVWWEDHKASLARTNYGLRFLHLNLSGRNDYFKIITQFGYTRRFSLAYTYPYLNRSKTLGFNIEATYSQNHEIQYLTRDDKQQFFNNDDRYILGRFEVLAGLNFRPRFRQYNNFSGSYTQNRVDQQVIKELNPDFFGHRRNVQRFFSLMYDFTIDNRNIKPYPTTGNLYQLQVKKQGLGIFDDINTLSVINNYFHYFPLTEKWNLETNLKGKLSLIRGRQPFFNYRAFGFGGTFVRGYELYIVDGLDYALTKNSLRYLVFGKEINWGKLMPLDAFRYMPLKVYLAANADLGIVNDPFAFTDNRLANELLIGIGAGLNVIVYYNKVIKLEYSYNRLGESGLYLHLDFGF